MSDAILLRHYARPAQVLRYVPETGEHETIAGPIHDLIAARGYFEVVDGKVVGAFASEDGPVFFVGGERLSMGDPGFAIEWERGEREHRFAVQWRGALRFEARYAPKTDWGWDNWSADEESADFLLWLYNSVRGDRFHDFYTLARDNDRPKCELPEGPAPPPPGAQIYLPGQRHLTHPEVDVAGGRYAIAPRLKR